MFTRRFLCSFALSAAALILPAGVAAAQDNPRIATVNPARVFNEMQETKDLKQKMENDRQTITAEGQKRQQDIEEARKKRQLFQEGSEEAVKANKDLVAKTLEAQVWQELIKADLARQQKVQMKSLFEKIEAATNEVAAARKLDLVIVEQRVDLPADLEQINVDQLRGLINQRTVMFNNKKYDITNEVLTAVDAKYKQRK
jgi:Skp family chaperone for outer membrane proteins